ncbi:glutamate racemase [Serpentinicella sp. ANB-PHB4]|uniref:glutamate racemase n=1 Tax=Serpentinicella sp. ANB-PHB4 TaxID=3074076 RepID=UPI00285DB2D8|nr:glutamate racemase [Serpentinicella sp. ANB-PHB4]MDR5659411.1 glutamate racemase [Serpentinicella sp. ANB-PHB4]
MINEQKQLPIAVFDSGVGGISVLAELMTCLPKETYIYFGDSKNAPYGTKTTDEVRKLTFEVAEFLYKKNVKALVVACNTATSAAINELRAHYKIPIIGMEPALKPAVEQAKGTIVVMATPVTLAEKKFSDLIGRFVNTANIIKLPCPGLVELIESGVEGNTEIHNYLSNLFASIDLTKVSTIVLGCTHYVFISDLVRMIVGPEINIVHGNKGTAKQLYRMLKTKGNINNTQTNTEVHLMNSSSEKLRINLSKALLEMQLKRLNWEGKLTYLNMNE